MTIPDYQTLMLPVLHSAAQGEVKLSEVTRSLALTFELSEEEISRLLPSGVQPVFVNRVGWAKTYLAKAGLLELTRRGYFRITSLGQNVITSNPPQIDNSYLMQFEGFREFKNRGGDSEARVFDTSVGEGVLTPDEVMRAAHRQIESALGQELIEHILKAPPSFFERLILKLLEGMGYGGSTKDSRRVLGGSGDGGVDGVIDQDPLGLDRVYVQAKRYAPDNNIGSGAIRDFFGSLDRHKANKGLFVTTSNFSPSARETADLLSKRIVLIDGKQLTHLMIRYDVGCRLEETLAIKKIDEDFFFMVDN